MKKYVVAILGARSAVGHCMYDIVKERKFPLKELRLISPSGAKGEMHGLPLLPLHVPPPAFPLPLLAIISTARTSAMANPAWQD